MRRNSAKAILLYLAVSALFLMIMPVVGGIMLAGLMLFLLAKAV